jgi:TonB family protein
MPGDRRRREETGSGWSTGGMVFSAVVHALAIGLIFFAPHPIEAPLPTAYTVELVDPSALGGKLLAGPIGGPEARQAPPPKPAPEPEPPPPEPEPEPEPEPPPPPEQLAKAEEPPPPPEPEDEEDPDAVALGTPIATPVATVTKRIEPTARPTPVRTAVKTAVPTAKATAKPTARPTTTMIAPAKPKTTATPVAVIAKRASPSPAAPVRRADAAPATPGSEARPKPEATPGRATGDVDDQLAAAIKGVEAKVEKSGGGRAGVGGATGPGGGMGGTERSLDGPAGIGGEGPGGGGTVRGLEFVVYYNQMLNRIKERWTWVGTRGDLRVTVHFSILPSGEITNIRLGERSGDQSYDGSVERAVRAAGPLPPPPEAYRSDFASVELTFRPADLQRPGN